LRDSIAELGRLPRRDETSYADAAWFVNNSKKRQTALCEMKRRALEQLPHWAWGHAEREAAWWSQLKAAERHLAEHGSLPKRSSALGIWVMNMRQPHRRRRLTPEQLEALEKCRILP